MKLAGPIRSVIPLLLLVAVVPRLRAQQSDLPERWERTADHLASALVGTFDWYDSRVVYEYYVPTLRPPSEAMRLRIDPLPFERSLAVAEGDHHASLGGMRKETVPEILLAARAAYCLGTDLLTEDGTRPGEYRHALAMYKALVYTEALTETVKNWTDRTRPDGSDSRSFFSGHAATTFAWATFLFSESDEFFDRWEPTASSRAWNAAATAGSFALLYGWASYVASSRVIDRKHYVSDVAVGAAVGTLIGRLVYDACDAPAEGLQLSLLGGVPSVGVSYRW